MSFPSIGGTAPGSKALISSRKMPALPSVASEEPKLDQEIRHPLEASIPSRPLNPPKSSSPADVSWQGITFTERPVDVGVDIKQPPPPETLPTVLPTPLKKANAVRSLKTLGKALNVGGSSKKLDTHLLDKGVDLIESYGRGERPSPKDCLALADELKALQSQDPKATTIMLRLYDIAADMDKDNAFAIRAKAASSVEFSSKHPLHEMTKTLDKSNKGLYGACGIQMEAGSIQVAEGLSVQKRPSVDAKQRDVLSFELTASAREGFESRLNTITENLDSFNAALVSNKGTKDLGNLSISHSRNGFAQKRNEKGQFSSDLREGFLYRGSNFYDMEFIKNNKFIGKVTIGQPAKETLETHYDGLYKAVRVEVPSGQDGGESVKTMQKMMTVLGLGAVLAKPGSSDEERKKVGLIAASFYPQAWDQVQRDENFNHMSPKALSQKVIEMLPKEEQEGAKNRFNHYEENPQLIGKREVIPGKEMLTLNDLSTQMHNEGLVGFMCGVGNSDAAASICNVGFFSTQMRLQMGIITRSASPLDDLQTLGHLSVFVRAETEETLSTPLPEKKWEVDRKGKPVTHFKTGEKLYEEIDVTDRSRQFAGKYQFILKKELIDGGARSATYGDWYGVSSEKHINYPVFKNRDNLIDFTKKVGVAKDRFSSKSDATLNDQGYQVDKEGNILTDEMKGTLNEVGIPGGCIPPVHFSGINCVSSEAKQELLQQMSERKFIENEKRDSKGNIVEGTLLLGGGKIKKPMNEFLHVGNQLKQEMWPNG